MLNKWICGGFVFLLLYGCGYHLGQGDQPFPTISLPYVEQDLDGELTAELTHQLASSGSFSYKHRGGSLILKVELSPKETTQIGYRRDRHKDGTLKKNIVPIEARDTITATVSLIEKSSCKVVFGPIKITADTDYDFVDQDSLDDLSFFSQNGKRITVLDFSLGQLESRGSAQSAAQKPLYRKLAKKIVDVISFQW